MQSDLNITLSNITQYYTFMLFISMLWRRQVIFESKGDKLSSSAECRIRTQGLRHQSITMTKVDRKIEFELPKGIE